jgi:hypothetical protein
MKNLILTIGTFLMSVVSFAQNPYSNIGIRLESILDSNGIFYVGMSDRYLLSIGQEGYIHKDVKFLDSFKKVYNDDAFKTVPDTTNIIFKESEILDDKFFNESETFANNMFKEVTNVIGYKYFETPNSKIYDKILVYETVVNLKRKEVYTAAIGMTKSGIWTNINSNN